MKKLLLCLSTFFFIPFSLFAANAFSSGKLLSLEYRENDGAQILELQFDRPAKFSKSFIPQGQRTKRNPQLILDFPNTKLQSGIVREHNFSKKDLLAYKVKKKIRHNGVELSIDLQPESDYQIKEEGKQVKVLVKRKPVSVRTVQAKAGLKKPAAPQQQPKPVLIPTSQDKDLVIVLDPGHGGEDVGAIGKKGHREKDVALAISKKLAEVLNKEKNFKVYLTRDKDKTLTLEQRNRFAREKKADLFVSVHANASTSRELKGVQTYYLNNASDEAAKRLASRENKYSGVKLPTEQQILSTMLQNENAEESQLLAHEIQRNVLKTLQASYKGVRDLKVQSALFYVLVGAKCPGVLVETSFISNPNEEARLVDQKYQSKMANGIAAGIKSFLDKQQKISRTL